MPSLKIRALNFRVIKLIFDKIDAAQAEIEDGVIELSVSCEKLGANLAAIIFDLKLVLENRESFLHLIYAVDFNVEDANDPNFEITNDTISEPFMKVNAPAIGYPFVRAFVATFSVNAGFNAHMLPAINFQSRYDRAMARQLAEESAKKH